MFGSGHGFRSVDVRTVLHGVYHTPWTEIQGLLPQNEYWYGFNTMRHVFQTDSDEAFSMPPLLGADAILAGGAHELSKPAQRGGVRNTRRT